MALSMRQWDKLRSDEEAFYRYLSQPTAIAEQVYDANFHLIDIRGYLRLIINALYINAALLAAVLVRLMGWI